MFRGCSAQKPFSNDHGNTSHSLCSFSRISSLPFLASDSSSTHTLLPQNSQRKLLAKRVSPLPLFILFLTTKSSSLITKEKLLLSSSFWISLFSGYLSHNPKKTFFSSRSRLLFFNPSLKYLGFAFLSKSPPTSYSTTMLSSQTISTATTFSLQHSFCSHFPSLSSALS